VFSYLFIYFNYQVLSTMQLTVQHRDNTMSTLKDAKAYSTHRYNWPWLVGNYSSRPVDRPTVRR